MKGLKTGHFPTNFDTYLCLRKIPSNALLVERMGCFHDANAYFSSLELYLAHIQAEMPKMPKVVMDHLYYTKIQD